MSSFLYKDVGGDLIQAMPLKKGFVNLEAAAVVSVPRIISCVDDGAFVITWVAGGTDTIDMVAGGSFALDNVASLSISSGKFHVVGKSVA